MRRWIRINSVDVVNKIIENAVLYSTYADKTLIFIHRQGKNEAFQKTELFFGKEHFMHLVGVKSISYSASDFYDACLNHSISIEDCNPSRGNIFNRNRKIIRFNEQFRFSNAKLYRIGENVASSLYNDFQIVTGNTDGMIGYSNKDKRFETSVPVSLLDKSLYEHCPKPDKIFAVAIKKQIDKEKDIVIYECSKGFYDSLILDL